VTIGLKAFKFRLYPNPEQEEAMLATMDACRRLWNDALFHRKRRWEEERKPTSYGLQQWILTAVRGSDLELKAVYSQVAKDVLHRLDRAFKSFFEHRSRYPRFKNHAGSGSFTYPQAYNGSVKPDLLRKRLYLSKIGNVRAVFHRPLPRDALLKTCTVTKEPCNEWYASMVYEDVVPLQNVEIPTSRVATSPIGIDLGLRALITASDGIGVPHPKFLRRAERRLRHLQRTLSRKKTGSKNRWKTRRRVASLHAKVARQRVEFNHKLSNQLAKEHDFIGFEGLRIRNMMGNHALAKSIHDAGWGQLIRSTDYKAIENSRVMVLIDPAYSTQERFWCGVLNRIPLETREFCCVGCGRKLQRDHNAARIVLKRAFAQVGQDMPELRPVETRPIPISNEGRASPVLEAGTRSPRL
jgi:putative transposase